MINPESPQIPRSDLSSVPAGWLISDQEALPYNPFLDYPRPDQIVPHEKGTPWLRPEDTTDLIGFNPQTIFCYTGSIKQPRLNDAGELEPPLPGKRFNYGAASFAYGEDPYRKDIQGTGGKVNVIGTMHLTETLPREMPVYTLATFSNDLERRMAAEQGMPTAAGIYEYELKRFGVTNPIRKLEDPNMTNSFKMIVATLEEIANHPEINDVAIVTLRYHIPRCSEFLRVCGMGDDKQIADWLFENWKLKTGEDLLANGFGDVVKKLHERGVRIKVLGAEDVMDRVDQRKIEAGAVPRYRSVLRLIYPPRLSQAQFEAMPEADQQAWMQGVKNLQERLDTEMRGVRQLRDGTYWAPPKAS